jgi:hypothetical protein
MFPYILGSVYVFFHFQGVFLDSLLDYVKIMLYICSVKKVLNIIPT